MFFLTGQRFQRHLDGYLRQRLRKGTVLPTQRHATHCNLLSSFPMHLGQHPKAGCSSLETTLSGRLTDLAGVPSLFRTIRSYYYTPGGLWVERCSKIAVEPTGYAYSFSQQPAVVGFLISRSNLQGRMQSNIEFK